MTTADLVEVLAVVPLLVYAVVEAVVIWLQRPQVVYDERTGRWRAQRGKPLPPPHPPSRTYPISHVTPRSTPVTRLHSVDDLAS